MITYKWLKTSYQQHQSVSREHYLSYESFFLRFYLFIHERHTEREAETQAEGEAGSMQGA